MASINTTCFNWNILILIVLMMFRLQYTHQVGTTVSDCNIDVLSYVYLF